jgi:putative endonuclease
MTYYVYMLTNRSRVVLYVGVTNSLEGRMWYHSNTAENSFVKRYKLNRLVYYETYNDIRDAIAREKQLKRWRHEKENDLVNRFNPKWEDLGIRMFGRESVRSLDCARDDNAGAKLA